MTSIDHQTNYNDINIKIIELIYSNSDENFYCLYYVANNNKNEHMKKIACICLMAVCSLITLAQQREIKGRITDSLTGEGLAGATVTVKKNKLSTVTDEQGYYLLQKLNGTNYVLVISYVGYQTKEVHVSFTEGSAITVEVSLSIDDRPGSEVVVSASKHREKITNAPASIQVIGVKDLEQFAGSNVGELVSKIQGVEYTRGGVDEITFNARGFHSAFNNKVFQLVDGRNTMTALSAGLALFNNSSISKDDIERIEIVLGPQSALYGPNAHNALFNFISKDPRKYTGTTVALSAGSQSQFSGRFRQATKINNKWAYKLSGEHATGKDYTWYDTVYAGGGPNKVFGDSVAIPERNVDFNFRRYRGEGHVYYSLTPKADIILSAGGGNINRLQVTTGGRNKLQNLLYSFLQARFVHPRFFANIYNTWGASGNIYIIGNYTRDFWNRTHSTITDPNHPLYKNFGRLSPDAAEANALRSVSKEKSERLNAEVQYNYNFHKVGLLLVTGLSYQKDKPNGYGLNLVDSFKRIHVTQYGAVLHLEKSIAFGIRFIAATRYDHHSNFGNFFSPKFGIVKGVADGNIRLTWGRAYSMPTILHQYSSINGFLFGNASGVNYIPNNTNAANPTSVITTTPLKPEQVSTWELGYKGTVAKNLFIDINYYNGVSKNFVSNSQTVGGRVLSVNGIPVIHNPALAGTVDMNGILRGASFSTYFNYGDVRSYGLDLGLNYTFSRFINLSVKYSWFGSDITKDNIKNDANKDNYVSPEEKCLNAPKHRGLVALSFQNLCKEKLFINLSARYVEQYDFYSASQIGTAKGKGKRGTIERPGQPPLLKNFDWGPLGGFTTVDVSAGYKFSKTVSVGMGITNLFNTRQIEFVGSPSIGRLIMFELKVQVPQKE